MDWKNELKKADEDIIIALIALLNSWRPTTAEGDKYKTDLSNLIANYMEK